MQEIHFGLKPLCIGKRDNTYFLASESCAIAAVDGEFVRDVLPGEIRNNLQEKHGRYFWTGCLPRIKNQKIWWNEGIIG